MRKSSAPAYSITGSIFAVKAKISNGRMILWQNNYAIILPENYSAFAVPACPRCDFPILILFMPVVQSPSLSFPF